MNQKGFVMAPIILWIVGALVLTGTVAVKEGLISLDLSEKITHDGSRTGARVGYQSYCNPEQGVVIYENEKMPFVTDEGENVLWTKGDIDCYKERKLAEKNIQVPIPTPIPTKKPSQGQVQGVTSNNQNIQQSNQTQAITHDGSRTGPIVDYYELCTDKTIKIYENERVPYKRITGEIVYSTKGDIKCYEDQINRLKNQTSGSQSTPPSTPSTPSEPLITCVLSYGTYQLSQSTCDSSKASDKPYTPPQYYPCTLCNPYDGTCKTYDYLYKTKEECEAEQQKRSQEAESIISQHNSQVESCRSRVGSQAEYTQRCNFYSGSAAQACRQLASQQWKAAYDACGTKV